MKDFVIILIVNYCIDAMIVSCAVCALCIEGKVRLLKYDSVKVLVRKMRVSESGALS
jgi:hypothetical protein